MHNILEIRADSGIESKRTALRKLSASHAQTKMAKKEFEMARTKKLPESKSHLSDSGPNR
jgi:hypothetical protein